MDVIDGYSARYPQAVDVAEEVATKDGPTVETALADIIGFPFRAAAWLAHVLL